MVKNFKLWLHFDKNLSYGSKILYVLAQSEKPMLVDDIAAQIQRLQPELELNKLHKSVSHNVSMLYKYAKKLKSIRLIVK